MVYAADKKSLIAIPENHLLLKYKTHETYPNAEKLIDKAWREKNNKNVIKISDLAKELAKARFVVDDYMMTCKDCYGMGVVEWTYMDKKHKVHTNQDTCPVCEGDGLLQRGYPFAKLRLLVKIDEETGIEAGIHIGDLCLYPNALYKLFMVANIKGCDTIELYSSIHSYLITKIKDATVLLMQKPRSVL